jgi:hypothetical protein
MKQKMIDHKIGKLLGSTGTASGYFLMIFGIIGTYLYNWTGSILIIAGMFMAFTYEGTKIDLEFKKIRNYTSLFGLIYLGKWYPVSHFKRFSIYKSKRSYTTYSRANVPLTLKNSDIRLVLLDETGSLKITINKYNSFDEARKEMDELIKKLDLTELREWVR